MALVRRGVPAAAALLVFALVAAWLARPSGGPAEEAGPWLVVPTPEGGLAYGPARAALAVGPCPPLCLQDGRPAWAMAPTRDRLAWLEGEGGPAALYVVSLAGSEAAWRLPLPPASGLLSPLAGPASLAWSPDGRRLFLASGEGPPLLVDVAQRALTPLPGLSPLLLRSLAWSPDGRYLALLVDGRDAGRPAAAVLVLDAASGRTRAQALALDPAPGLGWRAGAAEFCADTRLAWDGTRAGGREPRIWRLIPESGRLVAGPRLPEGAEPVACASSDAVTYAFLRRGPSGPADLFRLDANGWRRLTHFGPGTAVVAVAAGPGGELAWILGERGPEGAGTVWRILPGGAPRRLAGPGRYAQPTWVWGRPPDLDRPEPAWRTASMRPWPRQGGGRS